MVTTLKSTREQLVCCDLASAAQYMVKNTTHAYRIKCAAKLRANAPISRIMFVWRKLDTHHRNNVFMDMPIIQG